MAETVNVDEVRKATKDIVFAADKEDKLEYVSSFFAQRNLDLRTASSRLYPEHRDLTPRIVRHKVEEQLGLESGILESPEYKSVVKAAIAEATVRASAQALRTIERVRN